MRTPYNQRTNSSIVTAFVQANQELELKTGQAEVLAITEASRRRRADIEKKKGKATKKEVSFQQTLSKAEQFRNWDEHKIPIADLLSRLESTQDQGMNGAKATIMNQKHGDNVLSEKKGSPWYVKLFHEFTSIFSLMMWFAGILCMIAYALGPTDPSNLYLAIVCWAIVVISGLFTFYQNAASEAIMASFKNFIPPKANVLRDGSWRMMEAAKLVPGDIIKVKTGDRIPADFRVIHSKEMKVDNSTLTGESDALLRTVECTNRENPLETANLAFFGTLCKEGEAIGVVIRIGDNTVIGQIANLAASASADVSPLKRELNRFILYITFIAFGLGLLFFCLGWVVGYNALNNLSFGIGICTAQVPEGLLAAVTIALAITAKKLAGRKVLVKNLESVETLGSTSCICSDKTGTLTQNVMTVENVWYDGKFLRAHNYQKMGEKFAYQYERNGKGFKALHECAVVCSEAFFNSATPESRYARLAQVTDTNVIQAERKKIDDAWAVELNSKLWLDRPTVGDASETALVKFFQPLEDIKKTRTTFPIKINNDKSESKIPFNPVNKYAIYIVEYQTADSHFCVFVKGAPERVWAMCQYAWNDGKVERIDDEWKRRYDDVNLKMAKNGERVLGFAKLHLPKEQYPPGFQFNCTNISNFNVPLNNLGFLGLISLVDPPRDLVPFAVIKCKSAGIKVIMVTGDQPITATAIARQCNIISDKTVDEWMAEGLSYDEALQKSRAVVVHGDQLNAAMREDEGLPEEEKGRKLARWLSKPEIVFARTSPAQKLIIVQGCQKLGHCVAVTGDGVNDAPAIKKADVGISMGITGSDVTKDAADMILLTDDFSGIILGVEEGRKIFDNIKKTIIYCVSSNVSQMVPFILFVILQFPLPLTTIFVLLISVGTDMVPCCSFMYEDGELDIMTRPPRQQTEHMVTGRLLVFAYFQNGLIESACGHLMYFVIMNDFGFPFWSIFFTVQLNGVIPNAQDAYDEGLINYGNSDAYCNGVGLSNLNTFSSNGQTTPDWLLDVNRFTDLRQAYLTCDTLGHLNRNLIYGDCQLGQISPITGRPVCFSTDSVKYAQAGFFYASVIGQISNVVLLKTKYMSLKYQGMRNIFLTFSIHAESALMLFTAYCYTFNVVFKTRDNVWYHFGIMGIPISIYMLVHDEIRKYLIRSWPQPDPGKQNWFYRNAMW